MRDLIVLAFTFGASLAAFVRPWMGVIALAILAYLNPHRYAWGFTRSMPIYLIVFAATMAGLVLNARDREPFPWTRETKLFVFLLGWFTLTTFWAPDFPYAARNKWEMVMKIYVGLLPTFMLINSRERLRWLIVTIALSFGLIGLKGGIFALGTGFHHRVWGPEGTFYGGNNEIALALNMSLPLILLAAREFESRNAKLFFYAVFGFSICSIISSWSRGGLLTLCAVLGSMILTGRRKWLSIPLFALAFTFALPNLPDEWFDRMQTIETYQQDESTQGRFLAWRFAIDKAVEHPLTGGGFDTFLDAWVDAHSGYFKILGEHGFIALAVWLSLLFGTMAALERLRSQSVVVEGMEWIRDYGRALQISLLAYAVGGAFLNVAYWDIFYHLVALCALMKVLLGKAREGAREARPEPQPGSLGQMRRRRPGMAVGHAD